MEKLVLEGGHVLKGTVEASGAKNAVLPMMVATMLSEEKSVLRHVPEVRDVYTLAEILRGLGVRVDQPLDGERELQVTDESVVTAPYEMVSQMRASIYVLGPLLARRGKARVSLPGGCAIGDRPFDLHLKGMEALGAHIEIKHGYIEARSYGLHGAQIYLAGRSGSSVGATCTVMMAACLADGQTVIDNAACEPEVAELAHFLNLMGAQISSIGSKRLVIDGVKALKGAEYEVGPDRIEAGTLLMAGLITGGDVTVGNAHPELLGAVLDKLEEMGATVYRMGNACRVTAANGLRSSDVATLPYPGIPTDLQAQFMALLCVADGISIVTEKIYPDRFMHVGELRRMGANIRREGPNAIVMGGTKFSGAKVMASDLRAGACLALAGLAAEGVTEVRRVYHIDRGYERIERKLQKLGGQARRVPDSAP